LYAFAYDALSKLSVYKNLVEETYDSLGVELGRTYLDAGCGTGSLLLKMAKEGKAKAYGIDFSMPMLRQAKRKCKRENVMLLHFDLNKRLPFKNEFFDGIACVHTLYLLRNPSFTLEDFHRVLKEGSKLVLVDPKSGGTAKSLTDREYLHDDWLICLTHFPSCFALALMNILIFTKIDLKRMNFLPQEELETLLRRLSFEIVRTKLVYGGTSILIEAIKRPQNNGAKSKVSPMRQYSNK
jgi:ubiquinone/menaquinone biosynthesis C-methylase UbiE